MGGIENGKGEKNDPIIKVLNTTNILIYIIIHNNKLSYGMNRIPCFPL